jgi:hypothetical protein
MLFFNSTIVITTIMFCIFDYPKKSSQIISLKSHIYTPFLQSLMKVSSIIIIVLSGLIHVKIVWIHLVVATALKCIITSILAVMINVTEINSIVTILNYRFNL